jgi:hypothetical protein
MQDLGYSGRLAATGSFFEGQANALASTLQVQAGGLITSKLVRTSLHSQICSRTWHFCGNTIEAQFSSKENMKNRNRFGRLPAVEPSSNDHLYMGISLKVDIALTWQQRLPLRAHFENWCKHTQVPESRFGLSSGRKHSSEHQMNSPLVDK